MKFSYLEDIDKIIKLIEENKINGENEALSLFTLHVREIIEIGKFTIPDWDRSWRKRVYLLSEKFKHKNPTDFLEILEKEKIEKTINQTEVLDFYINEINYISLPYEESEKKCKELIQKYPYNPEFRHTYGNILHINGDIEKAIDQFSFAYEVEPSFEVFSESLFDAYRDYLEKLIEKSEYEEGKKLCNEIADKRIFWKTGLYHNYFVASEERFKDYIQLNKKIKEAEKKIEETYYDETQKSQVKIIEILGFFTAIIAFIFSTVSIGKNFSFEEAIIFNIALGITLVTFILMMNLVFSTKKIKIYDFRVIMFIILILSLILIVGKFGIPLWNK